MIMIGMIIATILGHTTTIALIVGIITGIAITVGTVGTTRIAVVSSWSIQRPILLCTPRCATLA